MYLNLRATLVVIQKKWKEKSGNEGLKVWEMNQVFIIIAFKNFISFMKNIIILNI